jgi:hypothetical protein
MVASRGSEPWSDAAEIRRGAFNLIAAHGMEGAQTLAHARAVQASTQDVATKWRQLARAIDQIAAGAGKTPR